MDQKCLNLSDENIKETIQTEAGPGLDVPPGRERILIVDDENSIALLNQMHLYKLGYQATAVTSSREALRLFHDNPDGFDLVITDQSMPEMTGEKLAQELLKIKPDIPIIMCAGFSSGIDHPRATSVGISAFVMKPFKLKELARTIRQILDHG